MEKELEKIKHGLYLAKNIPLSNLFWLIINNYKYTAFFEKKSTEKIDEMLCDLKNATIPGDDFKERQEYQRNKSLVDREELAPNMLSFYIFGAIVLDLVREVNLVISNSKSPSEEEKEIRKKLSDVRKENEEWVLRFKNIRNVAIAHPLSEKHKGIMNIKYAFFSPTMMSSSGECLISLVLRSLITNKSVEKHDINPKEDIKKINEYLEKLIPIYKEFFEIT